MTGSLTACPPPGTPALMTDTTQTPNLHRETGHRPFPATHIVR
jgi:hypothetical protein